jgi:poly(3-hydroxybutyrate) depolymerase
MLYDAYEVQRSLLAGASKLAGLGAGWLSNPANPFGYSAMGPIVAAGLQVFADAAAPHGKPDFGIHSVWPPPGPLNRLVGLPSTRMVT